MTDRNRDHIDKTENLPHSIGYDIATLDHGLLEMLLPEIKFLFRYFPFHMDFDHHQHGKYLQNVSLHVLKFLMVYMTGFYTPAMRSLGVKGKMTKQRDFYKYLVISSISPIIYECMKWYRDILKEKIEKEKSDFPCAIDITTSRTVKQQKIRKMAHERQYKLLNYMCKFLQHIIYPIQLYHHLGYMFRWIPSPTVSMNLSNMKYQLDENGKRSVNLVYGYRRLLYDEFLLALSILPLDIWLGLPKNVNLIFKQLMARLNSLRHDRLKVLSKLLRKDDCHTCPQSCGICNIDPIPLPYETACGHLYCYACLRIAITDNHNFRCIRCGSKVASSRPYVPNL